MAFETWKRKSSLTSSEDYMGNQILAKEISSKGYDAIINEYVYIDTDNVSKTLKLIPSAWKLIKGKGVDLGGGVGCISSTLAKKDDVELIYCVEMTDNAVKFCQPIVKENILKDKSYKVISVIGDYDQLELDDDSMDFAIAWDSMHHSLDPIKTFRECKRVLKKDGIFVIVDRAHNDSTPDSEIERMLSIVYDEKYLIKNYRPKDLILTRREKNEHEYRFFEWENFFKKAGFQLLSSVIIKTLTDENKKLKNDVGIKEIFVDYDLGAFGNRKVAFVLKPIKS